VTRRTLFLFAGVLLTPLLVFAHPGHTHKTMGVVSMIHENHLEVKDAQGKASTFTLDAKTRIRRGKSILKAADIKTGDRVVVVTTETKDKAGKEIVTVTEVQVGTATTSK
jgi:translation initiation factor IF-1